MSKRELLEYAISHKVTLYTDIPERSVLCRCRFGHNFLVSSLDEWCSKCKSSEFLQELMEEIESKLNDNAQSITLLDVDYFGNATFNCQNNHTIVYDIENIPDSCDICDSLGFKPKPQYDLDDADFGFIGDDYSEYIDSDEDEDEDEVSIIGPEEIDESITSPIVSGALIADIFFEWLNHTVDYKKSKKLERKFRKSNIQHDIAAPIFKKKI